MKVAVIGGEPSYMLRFRGPLLHALLQRGHEVVAITGAQDVAVDASLQAMGVRPRSFPLQRAGVHPWRELRTLRSLTTLLRREQPDLVIANTLKLIAYGGIATRRAGVPRYASLVTGLGTPFLTPRGLRERLVQRTARVLLKLGLERSEVTVFHNPDDRDTLHALGLLRQDQRSLVVDGSGVDLSHFEATPVPTDPLSFLFLGRILLSKGATDFINAALIVKREHPEVQFSLVGSRDRAHPHSLPQAEVDRANQNGIALLDHQADVRPCLERASVLVVPSHEREGMPRSILEAFASGRPVIASDVPGCRHAVEHGKTGWLIPHKSPSDLAAAMQHIVDDPQRAVRLGPQCRAIAERRFDQRRITQQLIEALRA